MSCIAFLLLRISVCLGLTDRPILSSASKDGSGTRLPSASCPTKLSINLLSILGPGEMFGELSLFDPGPRTSTATAVTDAKLHSLSHEKVIPWLKQNPEVSLQLLTRLSQRLRRTNEAVGDLVFSDVPGRVAKALIDLGDRFGKTTAEGLLVNHDLTQEELAQLVGASRETVNKALADFAGRGWLKLDGRSVLITDVERLSKRSR